MQPSDDTPNMSLVKWPFYLADGICLLLALMIGMRHEGPLAYLAIFALAIAGAIFVMYPYVREFSARTRYQRIDLRNELEAQRAMLASIATDSQAASRGVLQLVEQMRQMLGTQMEDFKRFESRMGVLEEVYAQIDRASSELSQAIQREENEEISQLSEELETLRGEQSKNLKECLKLLKELPKTQPQAQAVDLSGVEERLTALMAAVETFAQKADAPARAPRASKKSSLMQKALAQSQDGEESPAVSRIIGGALAADGAQEEEQAQDEQDAEQDELVVEPEEVAYFEQAQQEMVAENAAQEADEAIEEDEDDSDLDEPLSEEISEEVFDKIPEPETQEEPQVESEPEPAPETEPEPQAEEQSSPEPEPESQPEPPAPVVDPMPGDDPLGALVESTPMRGKKSARKAKGSAVTSVSARILIGIGNKPYVRGNGPGLSADKGVPMEFVEIGLWRWSAPEGAALTDVRIYKNDQTPAKGESFDIEAGQDFETQPVFE